MGPQLTCDGVCFALQRQQAIARQLRVAKERDRRRPEAEARARRKAEARQQQRRDASPTATAARAFKQADGNDDGKLTMEEFRSWCVKLEGKRRRVPTSGVW